MSKGGEGDGAGGENLKARGWEGSPNCSMYCDIDDVAGGDQRSGVPFCVSGALRAKTLRLGGLPSFCL